LIKGDDSINRKIMTFLTGNGVTFMFPDITVTVYICAVIVLGIIFSILMSIINIWLVFPGFLIGLMLLPLVIIISNNTDNNNMLPDIESIYDILRIQARAGIFIKDSLADCYMMVTDKRLKAALLVLCNKVSINSTIEEAVEEFNSKFNNRHIDVLCIVLNQAQSSGKTVQILSDMSEQIRLVRKSHSIREKGRLERRIEIIELLIFVGVIAIGIYSMGSEIAKIII